jgi:MFS family permease
MADQSAPDSTVAATAWAPLRRPLFRALWIATVVSSIGTWMHEVGAGWLMVTLTSSPVMVSLVQAASALPIFFLALPAGALADIVDRRYLLITAQLWMLVCSLLLGLFTLAGAVDAWMLLAITFALSCGGTRFFEQQGLGAVNSGQTSLAELSRENNSGEALAIQWEILCKGAAPPVR